MNEVDAQGISTRFFAFVGPVLPRQSVFVLEESFDRQGNATTHSMSVIPLKLHWGSIALGYARVWLLILVFAMPFILMWGEAVDFNRPELLLSPVLFVLWIGSLFLGRANAAEKSRLRHLREVTGLGVDPSWLEPGMLDARLEVLEHNIGAAGIAIDLENPTAAAAQLDLLPTDELQAVHALATYRAVQDDKWREVAARALAALPEATPPTVP